MSSKNNRNCSGSRFNGSMVQGSRLGSDIKRFEDIEAW